MAQMILPMRLPDEPFHLPSVPDLTGRQPITVTTSTVVRSGVYDGMIAKLKAI
jgi:hypothetical protein